MAATVDCSVDDGRALIACRSDGGGAAGGGSIAFGMWGVGMM